MSGWQQQNNCFYKNFKFNNFNQAIEFVNRVAQIAQELNHHPEILVHDYNQVKITTTTHDQGNKITDKDKTLVNKIKAL